jgi:hypothetical protein
MGQAVFRALERAGKFLLGNQCVSLFNCVGAAAGGAQDDCQDQKAASRRYRRRRPVAA